jgi:hypothetical protein
MPAVNNIVVRQGATFLNTIKYSQPYLAVKPISAVTKSGQAVVTATGHGIPDDWLVWIAGASGMQKINHASDEVGVSDAAYYAYLVDDNSVRLDVDTSRFSAYVSGGELLYYPPIDLSGMTARMQIRSDVDSDTVIHSLTTENGGITLGGANGTIALVIPAADTDGFTFDTAVYDLELVNGSVVTLVTSGVVALVKEVTR